VRLRNALSGLMPLGRIEESVTELKVVLESNPLSLFNRWWMVVMYYLARDYSHAVEQALFMIELDPAYYVGHWARGLVCMEAGNLNEAVAEYGKAADLSNDVPLMLGWLGQALGRAGEAGEARTMLERL
jgi:tetratricopeptide (TPR) repeat protein